MNEYIKNALIMLWLVLGMSLGLGILVLVVAGMQTLVTCLGG